MRVKPREPLPPYPDIATLIIITTAGTMVMWRRFIGAVTTRPMIIIPQSYRQTDGQTDGQAACIGNPR